MKLKHYSIFNKHKESKINWNYLRDNKNEKDYYREIIFLKYNINMDESNKDQSRTLIDKIKKIYDNK